MVWSSLDKAAESSSVDFVGHNEKHKEIVANTAENILGKIAENGRAELALEVDVHRNSFEDAGNSNSEQIPEKVFEDFFGKNSEKLPEDLVCSASEDVDPNHTSDISPGNISLGRASADWANEVHTDTVDIGRIHSSLCSPSS